MGFELYNEEFMGRKFKNFHLTENTSLPEQEGTELFVSGEIPAISAGILYLDLNIYRESRIKALIKTQSEDMYRLIKKVHFDGKYSRIKCVNSGGWKYCWDLAVRVQFIGKMQGLAVEPKCFVSEKERAIVYKSLILVNPSELWNPDLAGRFWNLQERIEFLIAKILFHECIHVMIFLGKTLPSGFTQTDIFLEFRETLELANSKPLAEIRSEVQCSLYELVNLATPSESRQQKQEHAIVFYEFLVHEKYSIKKTDEGFGLPWSNEKVARDYSEITALMLGGCKKGCSAKTWGTEVRKLKNALKRLYDAIDWEMAL